MSVRPTARTTLAAPQTDIDFKSEFVNSPAVLQAKNEETMGKLMSRLDQLQATVSSADSIPSAPRSSIVKTKPLAASAASDLHDR